MLRCLVVSTANVKCAVLLVHYLLLFQFNAAQRQEGLFDLLALPPNLVNTGGPCTFSPPYKCPHPGIKFHFHTRNTKDNPILIDPTNYESLGNSQFNRALRTKIIIHGFTNGPNKPPSSLIREGYFCNDDYNIFTVDFEHLASVPCAAQLLINYRFVAKCIAQFVSYLHHHPRGVKIDQVHIIGFSVGASIAGISAKYLNHSIPEKLKRITALEPAVFKGLESSDAHFVDIIRTCSICMIGNMVATGHAEFHVNGGFHQPGCERSSIFTTAYCNHGRASLYFTESIDTDLGFYAYPWPVISDVARDGCNEEYVWMGESVSNKARGSYYVQTKSQYPYAQGAFGRSSLENYFGENVPNRECQAELFLKNKEI